MLKIESKNHLFDYKNLNLELPLSNINNYKDIVNKILLLGQDIFYIIDIVDSIFLILIDKNKSNIIDLIRKLKVNFREIKYNLYLLRRQLEIILYLIQLNTHITNSNNNDNTRIYIEEQLKSYSNDKEFQVKELKEKIIYSENILNETNDAYKTDYDEISKIILEFKDYLNIENKLIIENLNTKSIQIRLYLYIFTLIKERIYEVYLKFKYFSTNQFNKEEGESDKNNIYLKMLYDLLRENNNISLLVNNILLYNISNENIFSKFEEKDWKDINKVHSLYYLTSKQSINQILNLFETFVKAAFASSSTEKKGKESSNLESGLLPLLKQGLNMGYYIINRPRASLLHNKYQIHSDEEIALRLFSLIENNVLKEFNKMSLAKVDKRNRYYIIINKGFDIDDLNNLIDLYLNSQYSKIKEVSDNILNSQVFEPINQSNVNTNKDKINHDYNINSTWKISLKFLCSNSKFSKNIPSIYFDTSGLEKNEPRLINKKVKCFSEKSLLDISISKSSQIEEEDIIIHVHGGAFVATSSTSHENYLRRWSEECNISIISIDYSLSPEAVFPQALNEVYQSYLWIVYDSGIKIKRIILAGDSAGGNLITSLTSLLIITNKRLPDLLLEIYPAVNLSLRSIYPSLLKSFNDIILPCGLLKNCLSMYLDNLDLGDNHFASPYNFHDDIIKKFPKSIFYVGSLDPLRDQTFMFVDRLLKNRCDVEIHEFKYLPHGFVSFDVIGVKYFSYTNDLIIKNINDFRRNG